MNENYSLFEQILSDYFVLKEVSGRLLKNPKVSLIKVDESSWKNFFTEKAVYGLSSIEEAERFSTFSTFDVVKRGELIVRKKRGNLLVDLMSRYKTPVWRGETGLTLESSYLVPLN